MVQDNTVLKLISAPVTNGSSLPPAHKSAVFWAGHSLVGNQHVVAEMNTSALQPDGPPSTSQSAHVEPTSAHEYVRQSLDANNASTSSWKSYISGYAGTCLLLHATCSAAASIDCNLCQSGFSHAWLAVGTLCFCMVAPANAQSMLSGWLERMYMCWC